MRLSLANDRKAASQIPLQKLIVTKSASIFSVASHGMGSLVHSSSVNRGSQTIFSSQYMPSFVLEICADSVESAMAAQAGGADRIELCASLAEGGITPSASTIELARELLQIDLFVLIRPRAGDFYYSDIEFEVMKRDIRFAKSKGINGIVSGVLDQHGRIDKTRTAELIALASPLPFTFHRAFDMTADPYQALEDLQSLGVSRLLTSGQAASAPKGASLLADLVLRAGDSMQIMPGGGVNESTIAALLIETGAKEYHSSAKGVHKSEMAYRQTNVAMGANGEEYTWPVVDAERVRAIRLAAEKTLVTRSQ